MAKRFHMHITFNHHDGGEHYEDFDGDRAEVAEQVRKCLRTKHSSFMFCVARVGKEPGASDE